MIGEYLRLWRDGWNHFWFHPRQSDTLAVIRILVGSMLVYTHAVWTFDLPTFMGTEFPAIPSEYRSTFPDYGAYTWSHFDWFDNLAWMWSTHCLALIVFAALMFGLWTRVTSILAFLFVVSYANRATGALFGLDQVNAFLALYLVISNCGDRFSIDSWLHRQQGRAVPTVNNTIATRLIQIHVCIVYLFAGLGKLQGTTWWNGEAIWGTIASYEYQTLDLTWMSNYMWLVNVITYVAVAWEVSYPFLIWPRLTRPIFLLLAVAVHLGIGLGMGMMTFGLIMIYANLAFIPPRWTNRLLSKRT